MVCYGLRILAYSIGSGTGIRWRRHQAWTSEIAPDAKSRTDLRFLSTRPRAEGRATSWSSPSTSSSNLRHVRLDDLVVQRFPRQNPCGIELEERERLAIDVKREVASVPEAGGVAAPKAL